MSRLSCISETWGSDFDYFMKIYSLMPFNAFNGSLVEHCLVNDCSTWISNIFTHSRDKKGKITKGVCTGGHRSDRWQAPIWPVSAQWGCWAGDPAPVPGWPGMPLCAVGWPNTYGRVTREWTTFQEKGWFGIKGYERLNTFQLINYLCVVTKFGMSLTKFLIE
jgi:hypothetical protein